MHIYIAKNGSQTGPYSVEQIHGMLTGGLVSIYDLAWHDGLTDWQALHVVLGLPHPPPVPMTTSMPQATSPQLNQQLFQPIDKPKEVSIAVKLLYVTLLIGLMRLWETPGRSEQLKNSLEIPHLSSPGLILISILIGIFTLLFLGYLVFMIDKGKNWARITFLVLLIVGIPFSIFPLLLSFAYSPLSGILSLFQLVAQLVAVILLFHKKSSNWYQKSVLSKPILGPLGEVVTKADSLSATKRSDKTFNKSPWLIATCGVLGSVGLIMILYQMSGTFSGAPPKQIESNSEREITDETTKATVKDAVEVVATSATEGVKYAFTSNSEIHFIGSKVTGSHNGGFKKFTGSFIVEKNALKVTGQKIVIDMNSLWADDEKLTGHLKSKDFFNVAKFPDSFFELTGLNAISKDNYQVSGNLTIMGKTKNINFPATANVTDGKAKIHAMFDINRKDFGIVYAGMADDLIRDEVVIELNLEAAPEG